MIHLEIEEETVQVPREFYSLIASLNEQLEEWGVPRGCIDRALDEIERTVVETLSLAEEESEDEDSDDEGGSEGS